jgi:hypothetical protein
MTPAIYRFNADGRLPLRLRPGRPQSAVYVPFAESAREGRDMALAMLSLFFRCWDSARSEREVCVLCAVCHRRIYRGWEGFGTMFGVCPRHVELTGGDHA